MEIVLSIIRWATAASVVIVCILIAVSEYHIENKFNKPLLWCTLNFNILAILLMITRMLMEKEYNFIPIIVIWSIPLIYTWIKLNKRVK